METDLLPLASQELLSLSCKNLDEEDNDVELDVPAIAKLTALTRLELIDYQAHNPDLKLLQNLRLEELILVDCPLIVGVLLVPGALTSLQKLHISDRRAAYISLARYQANLENPVSEGYLPAHQLRRLGATVLGMPSLFQLSGRGTLFDVAMAEELKSWHRSKDRRFSMTKFDWFHCNCVWRKPAQQ